MIVRTPALKNKGQRDKLHCIRKNKENLVSEELISFEIQISFTGSSTVTNQGMITPKLLRLSLPAIVSYGPVLNFWITGDYKPGQYLVSMNSVSENPERPKISQDIPLWTPWEEQVRSCEWKKGLGVQMTCFMMAS